MPLPALTHELAAYMDFNDALAQTVSRPLGAAVKRAFEGSTASTLDEVEAVLEATPEYRLEESWGRAAHRFMWRHLTAAQEATDEALDAELDAVPLKAGGELRLDPKLEMPGYYKAVQFHLAPKSFWGNNVYATKDLLGENRGIENPAFPTIGRTLTTRDWKEIKTWLEKLGPPRDQVRRALDVGCGIGRGTLALKELYPQAEIYGLDMSAPMLRYAHYRAEKANLPITFIQANAEHTDFDNGYFDLIVSYAVTHELPPRYLKTYSREMARILAPGGLLLNGDVRPYDKQPPLMRFMLDRQVASGSEPYWRSSLTSDLSGTLREYGFSEISELDGSGSQHFPWWIIARR